MAIVILVIAIIIYWIWDSKSADAPTISERSTAATPRAHTPSYTAPPRPESSPTQWRDPDHATVSSAIDHGTDIQFQYVDLKGKQTRRRVTPQRMFRADGLYVEGLCHLRRENRTFKLDRMSGVQKVH